MQRRTSLFFIIGKPKKTTAANTAGDSKSNSTNNDLGVGQFNSRDTGNDG